METGATALTAPTPPAPPAVTDGEAGKGAAEFLTLLTGETTELPGKAGSKPAAKPAPIAKAAPDDTAPEAAGKLTRPARTGGPLVVNLRAATDKAAAKPGDAAAAATVPEETELPAALLAALSAGGAQSASIAANALGATAIETADANPGTTTPIKAKSARPPAALTAKRDTGDNAEKLKTTPASGDAKADAVTAAAERLAKPQDHAASATAKAEEILTPTSPAAAAADALATGSGNGQTTEVRIPLGRETVAAQAAIAAPVLALRVHTKDGTMRSIEIRLDPVELGQVDVKLETGSDGKLKAVLSAENSDSFELLKRESGVLEAALRDAGVELGEDAITFTLNDQGPGSGGADARQAAYGGASSRHQSAASENLIAAAQQAEWRTGALDISV